MDFEAIVQLLRALNDEKVEYVVVGGVAVNLQGVVRATQDIDLFVRPVAENLERLKRALRSIWQDPAVDEITIGDLKGEFPTVRYGPPNVGFAIDILGGLGQAFRYEDLEFEIIEWREVSARVATPKTLYRMKKDTMRLQDKADAAELRERFGLKGE